jgi:lipoprotein-releasing system permease protein
LSELKPAGPFSAWEWMLAFRYLRAKKKQGGVATISLISFFCIAIAVMILIVAMAIFNGFRSDLLDRMLGVNGHAFVTGPATNAGERDALLARLRATPGVVRATPLIEDIGLISAKGSTTYAQLRGIAPADLRGLSMVAGNIKQGSLQGFGEGDYGGDLILIGDRMAESLGVGPGDGLAVTSPSGPSTAFGATPAQKTYTIGGVFSVGIAQLDSSMIYLPLQQAQVLLNRGTDVDRVEVMVRDPDNLDKTIHDIRQAAGRDALVTDWRDADSAFWGALQVERTMVRILLLLLVLIAAMTIISGVVMLVKNKERDVAILRTMGASSGSMMRVFMISGAAIGVLAVPVGVAAATLFCTYIEQIQGLIEKVTRTQIFNAAVYQLPHLPARIDWKEVGFTCLYTMGMSVVVTLIPSWRASRIDPVEALRYE